MSLSGSFEGMPPQDLLQWIGRGSKTGVLSVTSGEKIRNFFFQDGEVTGITSNRSKHRLGAFLLRKSLITESQLAELRKVQITHSMQLGELLRKRKLLDAKQLKSILTEQILEVVFEVLGWTDGDFVFEERELNDHEKLVEPITLNTLLFEGARRVDELGRVRQRISSDKMVFRQTAYMKKKGQKLKGFDRYIWELMTEPKSVEELIDVVNASEYDILDTLSRLLSDQIILRDMEVEQAQEEVSEKMRLHLNRAEELSEKQGYHESLKHLERASEFSKDNADIQKKKKEVRGKIINEAKKMITNHDVVPSVRQSFSSLAPENFTLSQHEGFVFSRIDGRTDIKSLRYLTNLPLDDLYVILHKFVRMGLVYLEDPDKRMASSKRKSR